MKTEIPTALIVSNYTGLNGFQSGASLRVDTLRTLLENLNFKVDAITVEEYLDSVDKNYKLIALTPFTAASASRKARRNSEILWFDHCDSWFQTRVSRLRNWELKQVAALFLDLFYQYRHPKYEIVSFISDRDSMILRVRESEKRFILPNIIQSYEINSSRGQRLVFIGDGNYKPNRSAVNYLKSLVKFLPEETQIHILGKGYEDSHPNLIFHGYVPSSELYSLGDIHLAPIFSGAGIKNKVAIPLSLGLPVVTTKHGANGIMPCNNLFVAGGSKSFLGAMLSAIEHSVLCVGEPIIYVKDETLELIKFLKKIL